MSERISKSEMYSYYLKDPKIKPFEQKLGEAKIQYFYFDNDLEISTKSNEVVNACLLSGNAVAVYEGAPYNFDQFDFLFLPPEKQITIKIDPKPDTAYKICLIYSQVKNKKDRDFEIQHFDLTKFVPRGELSTRDRVATYRTVWTAIKNGYYMSGFTNIPQKALQQGVLTSVNLVENEYGNMEIYPHIHPEYPEIYIYCIPEEKVAVTQYLINEDGESICRDLEDGDGVFFPGNLGHMNFTKPTYKNLEYCMYMWIIPTYGLEDSVEPITLRV